MVKHMKILWCEHRRISEYFLPFFIIVQRRINLFCWGDSFLVTWVPLRRFRATDEKAASFIQSNIHQSYCLIILPKGYQEPRNEVGFQSLTECISGIWTRICAIQSEYTILLCHLLSLCCLLFNPFMHNVVKWPNILLKSCGVHYSRFLKYVWPFYNIMPERVKAAHLCGITASIK